MCTAAVVLAAIAALTAAKVSNAQKFVCRPAKSAAHTCRR
jgi:hypothetical protein